MIAGCRRCRCERAPGCRWSNDADFCKKLVDEVEYGVFNNVERNEVVPHPRTPPPTPRPTTGPTTPQPTAQPTTTPTPAPTTFAEKMASKQAQAKIDTAKLVANAGHEKTNEQTQTQLDAARRFKDLFSNQKSKAALPGLTGAGFDNWSVTEGKAHTAAPSPTHQNYNAGTCEDLDEALAEDREMQADASGANHGKAYHDSICSYRLTRHWCEKSGLCTWVDAPTPKPTAMPTLAPTGTPTLSPTPVPTFPTAAPTKATQTMFTDDGKPVVVYEHTSHGKAHVAVHARRGGYGTLHYASYASYATGAPTPSPTPDFSCRTLLDSIGQLRAPISQRTMSCCETSHDCGFPVSAGSIRTRLHNTNHAGTRNAS